MGHLFGRAFLWGFIVPVAALVAFAKVWDDPWLLWAVPLGIVAAIFLFIAVVYVHCIIELMPQAKIARENIEEGSARYVERAQSMRHPHAGAPPER